MDFKNTQIAYAYKTKSELKSALFVYRIITKPFLVSMGKFFLKIALAIRFPIKPFTNFMFKQFCGGENLDDVITIAKKLNDYNVKIIPDFSIEGASDTKAFDTLVEEVKRVIDIAASNDNIPFAVFKPTGLIAAKYLTDRFPINHPEVDLYKSRVDKILSYASSKNVKVLVDAEDYMYQTRIDDVLLSFMQKYNKDKAIVFTTLQMYRNDRLDYLNSLINKAKQEGFKVGVKFVRGAYMEKERERAIAGNYASPIHETKDDTDLAFNKAIETSVSNIDFVELFCGTHNEQSVLNLINLIDKHNLNKNDSRIWFAQLYGMRDNISFNLGKAGYNIAKYLPYGPIKEVMPYLVRRAEENSSMGSQAKQEIDMLKQEISNS